MTRREIITNGAAGIAAGLAFFPFLNAAALLLYIIGGQ